MLMYRSNRTDKGPQEGITADIANCTAVARQLNLDLDCLILSFVVVMAAALVDHGLTEAILPDTSP